MNREQHEQHWLKEWVASEKSFRGVLERFYAQQRKRIRLALQDSDGIGIPPVALWFDAEKETQLLLNVAKPAVLQLCVVGANREMGKHRRRRSFSKAASLTGDDGPIQLLLPGDDPLDTVDLPPRLLADIRKYQEELFKQPSWKRIEVGAAEDLQRVIDHGIERGLSTTEIRRNLMDRHEGLSKTRAQAISRTETGGSLNAGHTSGLAEVAREANVEVQKEWLSVKGNTSREDHVAASGQRVPLSEDFQVGDEYAPWPSHYSLSPGQRVNCMCSLLSYIPALE